MAVEDTGHVTVAEILVNSEFLGVDVATTQLDGLGGRMVFQVSTWAYIVSSGSLCLSHELRLTDESEGCQLGKV